MPDIVVVTDKVFVLVVPAKTTLLNGVEAEPPMVCAAPLKVMVLVPAGKVAPLLVQFPPTEWLNDPGSKVAPDANVTLPPMARPTTAVVEPLFTVKLPVIDVVPI
jgi:hypothetical protein